MSNISYAETVIRLLFATALGMVVGFERQFHEQVAGLRTMSLVSLGACGFVLFSMYTGTGDMTRVAAQVVSGVGFLGAGAIMHDGLSVRGLTTAATMWCTAALGVLAAGGYYIESAIFAAGILLVNTVIRPLSKKVSKLHESGDMQYVVRLTCDREHEARIRNAILGEAKKFSYNVTGLETGELNGEKSLNVKIIPENRWGSIEEYAQSMMKIIGVTGVSWHGKPLSERRVHKGLFR